MSRSKRYTFYLTKTQAAYFLEMLEDDLEFTELLEHEKVMAESLARRLKSEILDRTD